MAHIAIQEQLNGKVVEWMESVTNEQYRKRWCLCLEIQDVEMKVMAVTIVALSLLTTS